MGHEGRDNNQGGGLSHQPPEKGTELKRAGRTDDARHGVTTCAGHNADYLPWECREDCAEDSEMYYEGREVLDAIRIIFGGGL